MEQSCRRSERTLRFVNFLPNETRTFLSATFLRFFEQTISQVTGFLAVSDGSGNKIGDLGVSEIPIKHQLNCD